MGEDKIMYIQIDSSNRVASWNLKENSIGSDSPDIKEITNFVGVDENNFNEYVWQSDNTLLHSPLAEVEVDNRVSLDKLRKLRDAKLSESDWRVSVSDYPHSDSAAWITYRQELRDLPEGYTPTENPVWPTEPIQLN